MCIRDSLDTFLLDGGSVSDNCGLDSTSFRFVGESISESGGLLTIIRKYTISDLCGNSDTCMQSITSSICFTDLALKAVINGGDPYLIKPGGTVPASGIVFNQGFVAVDSIKIVQYLTPGIKITSAGWTIGADTSKPCFYLSVANGLLPAGGLLPGDSITFNFVVCPGQIPCGLAEEASVVILADAIETVSMFMQPSESVPTTLYVFRPEGIICTVSDFAID